MTSLEPGQYVGIEEFENSPEPFRLASGFSNAHGYRALGLHNPSDASGVHFVLGNDRDEIWLICNRQVRTCAVLADELAQRLPLEEATRQQMALV
jgi:hypothetical protein